LGVVFVVVLVLVVVVLVLVVVVFVAVDGVVGQVVEERKAGGRRRREKRNGERRRPKKRMLKGWTRIYLPLLGIGRVQSVWKGGRRLRASAGVAVAGGAVAGPADAAGKVVLLKKIL